MELTRIAAAIAAQLPLDIPPYGLRALPECLSLDDGALVFHGALRAPLYRADEDAEIPPWEDVDVRLATARDELTTERAEALVAAWVTVLDEVLRSLARVPNAHRPAIAAHTIGRARRPALARVAPERFAHELRGPRALGSLMRLDPERAQPTVRKIAQTLAELLPIEAGGWRFARAKAPVCSTPLGIQATFALTRLETRKTTSADVLVLPAWALADVDRAVAVLRAQAIALAELLDDEPESPAAFELFDVAELLGRR